MASRCFWTLGTGGIFLHTHSLGGFVFVCRGRSPTSQVANAMPLGRSLIPRTRHVLTLCSHKATADTEFLPCPCCSTDGQGFKPHISLARPSRNAHPCGTYSKTNSRGLAVRLPSCAELSAHSPSVNTRHSAPKAQNTRLRLGRTPVMYSDGAEDLAAGFC